MYSRTPLERPPLGTWERWSSKEVVSDEGEVSMGLTTFVTSKAGLTKVVVFHEADLSKGVPLYVCMYSGTCLLRSPLGRNFLAVIDRWLL